MAILDLQRREMEHGRIRFGIKDGKRPVRLDHPLFTTPDKELADLVAEAHKAKVEPWGGDESQWQVELPNGVDLLFPVNPEPFSQWWERWAGSGCVRRCDGFRDTIHDQPCDCDKDSDKRACSPTTRFLVMFPCAPEAKVRVETKSLNAALDIPGAMDKVVGESTGEVLAGTLTVIQKASKKGKIPVPVVKIVGKASGGASVPPLGGGGGTVEVADASLPPAQVDGPSESPGVGDSEGPVRTITQAQIGRMMAVARENSVSTDDLKLVVQDLAGVKSRKDIPADKYDAIITALSGEFVPDTARREDV